MFRQPKRVCRNCGHTGKDFFQKKRVLYGGYYTIKGVVWKCPECNSEDIVELDEAIEEVVGNYFKEADNEVH